jgi:hypothetical protein
MKIDFNSGGAQVIDRIIAAYGYKTKLQLCKHLGVSSANLSMRYKRDFFPSDLVVRCIAETGVAFQWLVTGKGTLENNAVSSYQELSATEIVNGKLIEIANVVLDNAILPQTGTTPEIVKTGDVFYLINRQDDEIFSGKYLVEIEGRIGVYDLQRYPVNMLKISGDGLVEPIECKLNDVNVLAKAMTVIRSI